MPKPSTGPSRAAIKRARAMYDANEVSLGEIARVLKMHVSTFRKRREEWGWPPRPAKRAATAPPAIEAPAAPPDEAQAIIESAIARAAAPGEVRSHAQLVTAVRRAVEGELAAIEQKQASGERGGDAIARALASLARTLSVLRGLEAEQTDAARTGPDDADAPPLDLAELRHELARRLDRLGRARDPA